MSNISATQASLNGIHQGISNMRKDAHTIASQSVAEEPAAKDELTPAIVNLKTDQQQVAANAKTLSTQDQMLGNLLDELA